MKNNPVNPCRRVNCHVTLAILLVVTSFSLMSIVSAQSGYDVQKHDCFGDIENNSFKENIIQTAINHFSLSYSLYEENSVFRVSFADTVFSRTRKKENNRIKWINGKPYEGIVAVSIFRKLDKLDVTNDDIKNRSQKLPSRVLEKNGKLFYWHDPNYPVTGETLAMLCKYGLIVESQNAEEFNKVITVVFDDGKGAVYFFCRNNSLIFKSILTNQSLGTYAPPDIDCKEIIGI